MIVGEDEIVIKDLYYVLMKAGFGNVKTCKTLIRHHHVYVDHQLIEDVCFLVDQQNLITVDDVLVQWPFVYYMLNKPAGYLSATFDLHQHYVLELIEHKDCYCLGRLDKDTTGLLILTNDVSFQALLLPQNHIEKKYYVKVDHPLSHDMIQKFKDGILIDKGYICHPSHLEIVDEFSCFVTLDEGKYHQVKKMFLSCGYKVEKLQRVSFGHLTLDPLLLPKESRLLSLKEFQILEKQLLDIKRGI